MQFLQVHTPISSTYVPNAVSATRAACLRGKVVGKSCDMSKDKLQRGSTSFIVLYVKPRILV